MVTNDDKYSKKLELLLIFTNIIFCQYLSLTIMSIKNILIISGQMRLVVQ